jgi:hypothetical protein
MEMDIETVLDLPSGRSPVRRHKPEHRSRVSNNADLLPNIDGRSALARRYRDIANAIILDMGGLNRCSEARLQLIRRFAAAACIAEEREAALVRGEKIDITEHAVLCSTLVRIGQRVGINRVPKPVPSPLDYAASIEQADDREDEP